MFIFFFKDPKDFNVLLLQTSLAVMEVIMDQFQLHEGGHEDSKAGDLAGANSVFAMPGFA